MLETSVRLLRLLSLLLARRDWPGAELASRLGVTTRTVRNDVERLRHLGYQVHSSTGTTGGYRLGAGKTIPPLLLDDEEAIAIVVGLRAAASGSVSGIEENSLRALAKLEQTLPSRLRHRVDALRSATVSAAGGGPMVEAETLTAIASACHNHEALRFDYANREGEVALRVVEPYRLVYTGRRWYLLAWDPSKKDWRTFRADRVQLRPPHGPRFVPREPPSGDAASHVLRGIGQRAWRYQAKVTLHAPISVLADRVQPGAGVLSAVDDGTSVLETGSDSVHELALWLGGLDVDFTVAGPPELLERLEFLADRYARGCSISRMR